MAARRRGWFAAALVALTLIVAAPARATDGGPTGVGPAGVGAVETLVLEGRAREAVEVARDALAEAEAGGEPAAIAAALGALSKAWMLAGDRETADEPLTRAETLARNAGADRVLAALLVDRGNLALLDGHPRAALVAYRDAAALAATLADGLGDARLAATARVNRARALTTLGRADEATAALIAEATALPPEAGRDLRLGLARASLDLMDETTGPPPAPLQAVVYDQTQRVAEAAAADGDQRALTLALGWLAELYAHVGREEDALRLLDRAVFAGQQAQAPELLYRQAWLQGRLLRSRGDLTGATAAYRRAVAHVEAVRLDIPVEYRAGRSSFRATLGPLYYGLADLLLTLSADETGAEARQTLLAEARATVERLKAAELRDYFSDPCLAQQGRRSVPVGAISMQAAALYPILLPDRLELLVSVGDTDHQVTVPVGADALTATVRAFRAGLETPTTRAYLDPAQTLHDWLIAPIEPLLDDAGVDTLVIVPDGPLRTVPLAALHDGTGFLIERYAIATAPGLTLIEPGGGVPLRSAAVGRVLLAGLTEEVQGFPSLPSVARELEDIRDLLGGEVLQDEAFREPAVERELRETPFSVVHVASHGEFSGEADESFLLTFDGRLTLDELETLIKYGQRRDRPLELLTLSACRTAAGDDRAPLGLAGVAIKSGARSALASLWYVFDDATADLIVAFYRNLDTGSVTKAQALQAAQRTLLADRRYRHPSNWAPFILIGNWL